MTPDFTMERDCSRDLCPEVIEHRVKIEGLGGALQRIETRLDQLLWALLAAMAISAGALLVMLLKKG